MSGRIRTVLLIGVFLLALRPASDAAARSEDAILSRDALRDRIRGGWAGQMIGVAFGAKTEFQSNGAIGEWALP